MNKDLTDAEWTLVADLFERVGKKVRGSKCHLVVDILGLLPVVTVTATRVQDRDAATAGVAHTRAKGAGLRKLYTDTAYGGQCAQSNGW